jgi:hypothetical protein
LARNWDEHYSFLCPAIRDKQNFFSLSLMLQKNKQGLTTFFDIFSCEPFKQILLFLDNPIEIANWRVSGTSTLVYFPLLLVMNKTFFFINDAPDKQA